MQYVNAISCSYVGINGFMINCVCINIFTVNALSIVQIMSSFVVFSFLLQKGTVPFSLINLSNLAWFRRVLIDLIILAMAMCAKREKTQRPSQNVYHKAYCSEGSSDEETHLSTQSFSNLDFNSNRILTLFRGILVRKSKSSCYSEGDMSSISPVKLHNWVRDILILSFGIISRYFISFHGFSLNSFWFNSKNLHICRQKYLWH